MSIKNRIPRRYGEICFFSSPSRLRSGHGRKIIFILAWISAPIRPRTKNKLSLCAHHENKQKWKQNENEPLVPISINEGFSNRPKHPQFVFPASGRGDDIKNKTCKSTLFVVICPEVRVQGDETNWKHNKDALLHFSRNLFDSTHLKFYIATRHTEALAHLTPPRTPRHP